MGCCRPAARSYLVNRAQRRAGGHVVSTSLVVTVEEALELNRAHPLAGMATVLHDIRAEFGLQARIALCAECAEVTVLS